jgi:hypothetical protein
MTRSSDHRSQLPRGCGFQPPSQKNFKKSSISYQPAPPRSRVAATTRSPWLSPDSLLHHAAAREHPFILNSHSSPASTSPRISKSSPPMRFYAHTLKDQPREKWEPLFTPFGEGEHDCQRHTCPKCEAMEPQHGHLKIVTCQSASYTCGNNERSRSQEENRLQSSQRVRLSFNPRFYTNGIQALVAYVFSQMESSLFSPLSIGICHRPALGCVTNRKKSSCPQDFF